jgi:hypothetical protein
VDDVKGIPGLSDAGLLIKEVLTAETSRSKKQRVFGYDGCWEAVMIRMERSH